MFKVTPKFNRCLSITLATGKVIDVKVMGEKVLAATDAKLLTAALVSVK